MDEFQTWVVVLWVISIVIYCCTRPYKIQTRQTEPWKVRIVNEKKEDEPNG